MTRINFSIVVPDFVAKLLFNGESAPQTGELWKFGTQKCKIVCSNYKETVVDTKRKKGIVVSTKALVEYGEKLEEKEVDYLFWEI